uniref:Uncharacterized protein n=1 Tax=Caenorhabditis japonica TaxID=281687 RepID=A0A8R1DHN2_CAEJA
MQEASEIAELQKKYDKREEVKKEVKRRIEEEEKEKKLRKETEDLLKSPTVLSNNQNYTKSSSSSFPKLGRRFNNSQYFNWSDDDDIPVIRHESPLRPISRRTHSPLPPSASDACQLCTLAMRGTRTQSEACAHMDAFLASHRH